jgi:uncharacterized protein YaeQ
VFVPRGFRDADWLVLNRAILRQQPKLLARPAVPTDAVRPMAPNATPYHFKIALSDVDRGVYESLDLRPARHPSESFRYLLTRTLAYCLSYEDGIAFSKGGLSSAEEAPITIRDPGGRLLAWIDIGSPSAERLHKATKAAERVVLYTHAELHLLRREALSRVIHKLDSIEVFRFDPAFLDALEPAIERTTSMELVRTDGTLYLTIAGKLRESSLESARLVE